MTSHLKNSGRSINGSKNALYLNCRVLVKQRNHLRQTLAYIPDIMLTAQNERVTMATELKSVGIGQDPGSLIAEKTSVVTQASELNHSSALHAATVVPHTAEPETARWEFRALPYREVRRRFWHMSPGLLPFGLHMVSHADPISPTLRGIIVGICVVLGMKILTGFRKIERLGEGSGASAVTGYALSVLLTVLLFPGHLEIGVAVLSVLAFGDGSATLFGLLVRGPRLPWNQAKSWSGLAAFIVVGSLMTAWIYCGETRNPEAIETSVSYLTALSLVTPAVVAAAFAESVRTRLNDNIRVGITASVTLAVMHFLFRPM